MRITISFELDEESQRALAAHLSLKYLPTVVEVTSWASGMIHTALDEMAFDLEQEEVTYDRLHRMGDDPALI